MLVLLLFLCLAWRGYKIALSTKDTYGKPLGGRDHLLACDSSIDQYCRGDRHHSGDRNYASPFKLWRLIIGLYHAGGRYFIEYLPQPTRKPIDVERESVQTGTNLARCH